MTSEHLENRRRLYRQLCEVQGAFSWPARPDAADVMFIESVLDEVEPDE